MAVTWTIYSRETPDLRDAPATLVCEVEAFTYVPPEPVYDDPLVDLNFVVIDPGWDPPFDPLLGSPWVDELRFRVKCTAPDSQRELAWAFSIEVARAAHGAIVDAQAKTFAWYGWNLDAMLARVHALIEAHQLADLVAYLTRARDARTDGQGPFLALAERTIAYLDDLPESTAKNHLLVFLTASRDLPADVRHLLEDAVLAAPPKGKPGKPLRDLQAKLRVARDHAWADAQALPTTLAELAALWDRAHDTLRETYVLDRVFESERLRPLVVDAILARARAGEDRRPGLDGRLISESSRSHTPTSSTRSIASSSRCAVHWPRGWSSAGGSTRPTPRPASSKPRLKTILSGGALRARRRRR